jgi:hypothetical protein
MPSAQYYRDQAQVLLAWALATRDEYYAAQLTKRAKELLAKAGQVDDGQADVTHAIDQFNQSQPDRPSRAQQQQQVQPKNDHGKV